MSLLRPLNFGTLPTLPGLGLICTFEGTHGFPSVRALYERMVLLQKQGETERLRELLATCGFEWRAARPVLRLVNGGVP